MPKPARPKRSRSPNSANSNSHGHQNKKYSVPTNSTLDSAGNLMLPPPPRSRSQSMASMTSQRSSTSNRMSHNKNIQTNNNNIQQTSKPKPIIVEAGLTAVNSFLTPLLLSAKPFLKLMGTSKTQILSATIDDKIKIIEKLKEQKFAYFTYSEPSQKSTIYVLKKYFAAKAEDLLATLKEEKLEVEKVTILCPVPEFPSFLVHFKPQAVNLTFLERSVKTVGNVVIKWDRFDRSRKRLTQCHNCQGYGHASSNCGKKSRCVKCLSDHPPGECLRKTKEQEGTPMCVNCKGEHAANSSICPTYISYSGMVQRQRTNRQAAATFVSNQRHRSDHQTSDVAPVFDRNNFPQLSHDIPLTQNVSQSLNGNLPNMPTFAKISSLQARLAAVSDISEVLKKFEALVVSLESAKSVDEKVMILVNSSGIQYAN